MHVSRAAASAAGWWWRALAQEAKQETQELQPVLAMASPAAARSLGRPAGVLMKPEAGRGRQETG